MGTLWGTFKSSLPAPRAPVPLGDWRWYPWQAVDVVLVVCVSE